MKVARFLSKYLKAGDLPQPQLLTIERVEEEQVGDDEKMVVYFTECDQGIVLGPTTIGQIVEALGGEDTDEWIGWQIVAFNDPTVMYGTKKTGGIRFRKAKGDRKRVEIAPKSSPFANGKQDQDDLPF